MMHDARQSYSPIVPKKAAEQRQELATEAGEGRGLAKGNSPKRNASRTQRRTNAPAVRHASGVAVTTQGRNRMR